MTDRGAIDNDDDDDDDDDDDAAIKWGWGGDDGR
jgi:hypothetical protein